MKNSIRYFILALRYSKLVPMPRVLICLGVLVLAFGLAFVACNESSQTPTRPEAPAPLGSLAKSNGPCSGNKTQICHHPPGNPENTQLICVSNNAVDAHLNHGDHLPLTFWQDSDGDGFGAGDAMTGCVVPDGFVENADDCDDGDGSINPNATDVNCNGVDENCSGAADEGFVSQATSCGVGACSATGATSCSAGIVVDSCTPGTATAEVCDGVDNDCDGDVDEGDVCEPATCPCEDLYIQGKAAWETLRSQPWSPFFLYSPGIDPRNGQCIDLTEPASGTDMILTSRSIGQVLGCHASVRDNGNPLPGFPVLLEATDAQQVACAQFLQTFCR